MRSYIIPPLIFFAFAFTGWAYTVGEFDIPKYILPTPQDVFQALFRSSNIYEHAAFTSVAALLGFVTGNAVGFLSALVLVQHSLLERALMPFAVILKTTPVIAIAPFLVMWFGTGIESKIVASAVICFFPMLVNTVRGIRSVDSLAVEYFFSLGASRMSLLRKLQIPYAAPYLFSALKISSSLAVVGAVVGEFVGARRGLGLMIVHAQYRSDSAQMFAALVMLSVVGVSFYLIVSLLESRTLRHLRFDNEATEDREGARAWSR